MNAAASASRPAAPDITSARVTAGTGAHAVLRVLEQAGVTTVFGIPGGAILPLYQALPTSPSLRHILTRHEQGAGHAASGYARVTGGLGVCWATSGPGATNLVTPLMDAHMDSVPVLAVTGQVDSAMLGTDAFQETDICSVVRPVTKHSVQVTRADAVAPVLVEAMHRAVSGRPGPVLVDITKDALLGRCTVAPPPPPARAAPASPDRDLVERAALMLLAAERPVLYAGGGVVSGNATGQLRRLAELTASPVVTTLTARGAFPSDHPLDQGMPGMHGTVSAVMALQRSDVILAVGARFDDRVTGQLGSFAPGARVIHIDIDPRELSRKRHADIALHADCASALDALHDAVRNASAGPAPDHRPWLSLLHQWRTRFPVTSSASSSALTPQYVIGRLGDLTSGPRTVYTTGVGQHQMWAAHLLTLRHPRRFVTSGGAGTMGYAIPAAMGAQAALPDHQVWAVDGDGSFQMTQAELATCVHERLPVKVAVVNNGSLGMVRQWQDLYHERAFLHTDLAHTGGRTSPDIALLAEAYGCQAFRCERPEDVDRVIGEASAVRDRPVVIDFRVTKDALVWPMVPPGAANDEILIARDVRPDFEEDV